MANRARTGLTPQFDILIIGSGPSGVQAALVAAAAGHKVALLDIGYKAEASAPIPERPFEEIRRSDPNQHLYFLGDDPQAVLRNQDRGGTHLTPARQYMVRDMDRLLPLESDSFAGLQSTGEGGLGVSWGANCFALEDAELARIGIPPGELRDRYNDVAREIGVSGRMDDLAPFIANMDSAAIQPALPVDSNAECILRQYELRRKSYNRQSLYLGQSLLAMLSRPLDDRQPNPLFDMDFWADFGKSVYRPQYTVAKLERMSNVTRLSGRLAVKLEDEDEQVTVCCTRVSGNASETFTARKVVLAAGAIGSGRLALASFGSEGIRLPLLCNPNHWAAAVNLGMLGRAARDSRHSLSQLTMLMKTDWDGPDYVLAQLYSYRSLLYFRLLKNIPLPPKLALQFLRLTGTALTMVNIHFPDRPSPERWMRLRNGIVEVDCHFSEQEKERIARDERRMLAFLRSMRCFTLGVTRPQHGASIHYAGTLPYSEEQRPMTTDLNGRLHGCRNVYVADGSTWRYLPAKGLTFTLMANARRVAGQVVRDLAG